MITREFHQLSCPLPTFLTDFIVYMTVAVDFVVSGISEPVRFIKEVGVKVFPTNERFWNPSRPKIREQYILELKLVRRILLGSGPFPFKSSLELAWLYIKSQRTVFTACALCVVMSESLFCQAEDEKENEKSYEVLSLRCSTQQEPKEILSSSISHAEKPEGKTSHTCPCAILCYPVLPFYIPCYPNLSCSTLFYSVLFLHR